LDDDGNSLIFRKSQIRKVGQEIQGKPSLGESFRAICEGVEHIKSMNGGVIPPGNDVKLRIVTQNGEDFVSRSLVLNPHTLVSPDKLTPDALNKAMADPGNRKAINAIHEGDVHMHIIRSNEQTARETFIGKDGGSASVTVELSPRK
jgi:hypothetical protein